MRVEVLGVGLLFGRGVARQRRDLLTLLVRVIETIRGRKFETRNFHDGLLLAGVMTRFLARDQCWFIGLTDPHEE